jgi:hypothetical protein
MSHRRGAARKFAAAVVKMKIGFDGEKQQKKAEKFCVCVSE